jgi:diguanylate cyclase (GGDEF)-like protein
VARAAAHRTPLALILIDLDFFKSINDYHGHRQGDHVLAHVGQVIKAEVGECGGHPIRYAGDEFAVLWPGATKAQALDLGRRLVERVRQTQVPILDGSGTLQLTLSVGVAAFPEDTDQAEALFDRADTACYAAKRRGRDQAAGYEEEQSQVLDRVSLFRSFPCPRLVARGDLMARLLHHLFPAREGAPQMVILQGPAGVGKSRLLHDLRQHADPQRTVVVAAGGIPYLMSQPFGYLIEALDDVMRQEPRMGSRMASVLTPGQLRTASRLLPEMSRHVLLQAGSFEEVSTEEIPQIFAAMLLALAGEKRLLLLLDDFQWVDPGTLATLTAIWDDERSRSVSVLVSLRSEAFSRVVDRETSEREAALREFISNMVRANRLAAFPVQPLEREAVHEMVAAIVPPLGDHGPLLDLIWERSSGLPLLVEEILRYLITCESIRPSDDGRSLLFTPPQEDIPEQATDLLRFQSDRLDHEIRVTMARMATLGQRFDFQTLLELEQSDEGYLRHILERAKEQRLILDTGEAERYEFASEQTRQALYETLSEEERRFLHAQIADYKEKQFAGTLDSVLADLAYHYSQAGNSEKAEHYMAIVQALYRGFYAPSEVILVGQVPDLRRLAPTRPLNDQETEMAIEVGRLVRGCLISTRMYGPEPEHVQLKYKELHFVMTRLLSKLLSLDLAEAAGKLLINGRPVASAPDLAEMLAEFELKSLSFKVGITLEEVRQLVGAMLLSKEERAARGGLARCLKEAGVSHILPNEKIFVHVAERDILLKKKDSDETILLKDLETLRKITGAEDLDFEVDPEMAEILRTRVGEEEGEPETPRDEQAERPRIPRALPAGDGEGPSSQELARLRQEIMAWHAELGKYINLTFLEAVSSDWSVLCRDLESGDRIKILAACKAFTERGKQSVEPLLSFVALTEDPRARKIAIHLLEKLTPDVAGRLMEKLVSTASGEEKVRLIAATEDLRQGTEGLAGRLETFVYHPSHRVRQVAIRALARLDRHALWQVLREAIGYKKDPEVQRDAAEAMGTYGFSSGRDLLVALCRRRSIFVWPVDPRIQEAACLALGRMATPAVLKVLAQVLGRTGLLWRTKPSRVRAAAALALARGSRPEDTWVQRLLERTTRDSDPLVRAACRLALDQQLRQGWRLDEEVQFERDFFASLPQEAEEVSLD